MNLFTLSQYSDSSDDESSLLSSDCGDVVEHRAGSVGSTLEETDKECLASNISFGSST